MTITLKFIIFFRCQLQKYMLAIYTEIFNKCDFETYFYSTALRALPAATRLTVGRRRRAVIFAEKDVYIFWVRKVKFWNMFEHSFSTSVFFTQVPMWDEDHIFNAKSSRRREKSNMHEVRQTKITKNEKNWNCLNILKSIKNINARFAVLNNIVSGFKTLYWENSMFKIGNHNLLKLINKNA